ncbi:MAG: DeoR/GlpR family DNA-binding transcription regulator [Anaerolineales bacterium]
MSKTLIPAQRRERIQAFLVSHRIASTTDLCELLDVSEATVRRDLEWLEDRGLLERTHGGAILNERINLEQEYQQRAMTHIEEKRKIGAVAASLIEAGDILFINSGTTTTQLIRHIPSEMDITIITNNLVAVLEIGEVDYEVIVLGGSYQPRSNSVAGRFAVQNLSQVYANKAFIGVDGITIAHGCTVPSNAEAEVVHRMVERTQGPIYILADHSKWGVVSNFEVTPIQKIHALITDSGLDQSSLSALTALDIELLVAETIQLR